MPLKVLNENWTDYNFRKIHDRLDADNFDTSQSWEVNYLVDKITSIYPIFGDVVVRKAIEYCSSILPASHPRRIFVTFVIITLRRHVVK